MKVVIVAGRGRRERGHQTAQTERERRNHSVRKGRIRFLCKLRPSILYRRNDQGQRAADRRETADFYGAFQHRFAHSKRGSEDRPRKKGRNGQKFRDGTVYEESYDKLILSPAPRRSARTCRASALRGFSPCGRCRTPTGSTNIYEITMQSAPSLSGGLCRRRNGRESERAGSRRDHRRISGSGDRVARPRDGGDPSPAYAGKRDQPDVQDRRPGL